MAEDDFYAEERSSSGVLILLAGVALLLAIGALAWIYSVQSRLDSVRTELSQIREQTIELAAQQAELRRNLRATSDAFGAKVGITQQQIEKRAQEIEREQKSAANRLAARISQQEVETRKQVGSVSKAVSNVRTDVGGVKQDVASTRKELATTEQQLHAAIGDMGVQSGLIAKNTEQLEYLKRLGDRTYFEFTLHKGQPLAVSTIKLRLRKADTRHSRYTLEVFADDKRVEKKNRDLNEPLQFYAGKHPVLFEVVVNQIEKNTVSGYLSTPKSAPQPFVP
jgi:septal ring factor EnvC (AmiA/AmiB activator)